MVSLQRQQSIFMKKLCFLIIALFLFSSHDMFLKLDGYFLEPNTAAAIKLFNGTFEKSENTIDRDRMTDVSLVGNGNRVQIYSAQWSEQDSMTVLNFSTKDAGTWVAGVSTRPRNIELAAADFNGYLEHDGVIDMLEWRKNNNALDKDAIEKYSKHVKTIFQVGNQLTDDWKTELGYPIEFIPQSNPYDLKPGDKLQVKLLWQGKPLANQLVYIGFKESDEDHDHSHDHDHSDGKDHDHDHSKEASHDHSDKGEHEHKHEEGGNHDHDHDDAHEHDHEHESSSEEHHHDAVTQVRTDEEGNLTMELTDEGTWYLRTIYLIHSEEEGLTHESNWATLTFALGHKHSDSAVAHSHESGHDHHHDDHEHSSGIPGSIYWIASFALLIGLFIWFNRKSA